MSNMETCSFTISNSKVTSSGEEEHLPDLQEKPRFKASKSMEDIVSQQGEKTTTTQLKKKFSILSFVEFDPVVTAPPSPTSSTGTTMGLTMGSTMGSTKGSTKGSTMGSTMGSTAGTTMGSTMGSTKGSTTGSTTGTTFLTMESLLATDLLQRKLSMMSMSRGNPTK